MNRYELVIKNEIQTNIPINTFSVIIKYMHGDADHYTQQTFNFPLDDPDPEGISIQDIIYIVQEWKKIDWNIRCDSLTSSSLLYDWFVRIGYTYPDIVYDIFERDVGNYNSFAHIDGLKVYWFNEHGIKYNVEVIDLMDNTTKVSSGS